ncbi:MAG: hypothetical protein IPK32_09660 [Verrucomicrobiaceae bacterium]|nr:hypothetical protein [Verrucomicrobiaceae bacterium]
MEVARWLVHHGESLLESIGIIGGLIFTGIGLHRDSKARRIENMISLTQQHRDIWSRVMDAPELAGVQEAGRDLVKEPPTDRERLFMRSLILHLSTVYRAVKMDELLKPHGMERNVCVFFSAPLPLRVWTEIREFQDPDFVVFVEKQLR